MSSSFKIVLPMAGYATRMRPQTWSKPKPLVSVAGRPSLDHLLEMFTTLPTGAETEYVFIVSPGLGETQIPAYMQERHPKLKVQYVLQPVMRGQSDALHLARALLQGPMLMCFSDTLLETDYSFLGDEQADVVAWVKPVPDPRRFGVAELDAQGWVKRLVEKPESMDNPLVVVGCYFFHRGEDLTAAIEEQFRRRLARKGEYFLTDAVNVMIEQGAHVRTTTTEVWLDTGTISATLETNRYLLAHGRDNSERAARPGVRIIPPVFIDETAKVSGSTIGPHVSIGAGCSINHAWIADSILESGGVVESVALQGTFLGRQACVHGHSADDPPLRLNLSDCSSVLWADRP
jgi:glucose-1-phosphate thymidylyltransferase